MALPASAGREGIPAPPAARRRYRQPQQCTSRPSLRCSSVVKGPSGRAPSGSTRAVTRLHTYCGAGRGARRLLAWSVPSVQLCRLQYPATCHITHRCRSCTSPAATKRILTRVLGRAAPHLGQQAGVGLALLGLHALHQRRLVHLHLARVETGALAHWCRHAREAVVDSMQGSAVRRAPAGLPPAPLCRAPSCPHPRTCGAGGSTGPSSSVTPRTTAACHASPGSSFSDRGRPRARLDPLGSTCSDTPG